jgi:hypothetical protein
MPFSKKKFKKTLNSNNLDPCIPLAPYENGIVLQGYDVVEYHNLDKNDKGVLGLDLYKYIYQNGGGKYTFNFKDKKNLEKFKANSEYYIPQFGGFCSWGFANEWGSKDKGDPNVPSNCKECINNPPWAWTQYVMGPPADPLYGWTIYKDKLYFNINSHYRTLWEKNMDVFIKRATDRWRSYYCDEIGPINVKSNQNNWRESTYLTKKQQDCLVHNLEKQF